MLASVLPVLTLLLAAPADPTCGDELAAQALLNAVEARARVHAERIVEDTVKALEIRDAVRREAPNPRAAKSSGATSQTSPTANAVDSPSLTQLLALAVDQGLAEEDRDARAITLNLNGQAIAQVLDPGIADSTESYRALSGIRRLGGKLTLGGNGESFDRDGDGVADEALQSKSLDDSIAWELQYRAIGTRDRRDMRVAANMIKTFREAQRSETVATEAVLRAINSFAKGRHPEITKNGMVCSVDLDAAFAEDPGVQAAFATLLSAAAKLHEDYDAAVKAADRAFLLTAFTSGISRKAELGRDKFVIGARAVWGTERFDHTFNISYARNGGESGAPRPKVFNAGYEGSGLINRGLGGSPTRCSLFASWQHNQDDPTAQFKDVVQAGGTVELTIASGLKLPLTVKWVNHRDLLEGASEVVGNVGVTLDLSELKKGKPEHE